MAEPSEIDSQVNRTREKNDPAAFSPKPALEEKRAPDFAARISSKAI